MLRSLSSAVSGLQNFQQKIDVIGNNIANVNTSGYKASRVEFQDAFSQTLRGSTAGTGTASGTTAMQIGTGVSTSQIRVLDTQGAITRTGVNSDMAIAGEGYFVVKDPQTGTEFATRDGSFRQDQNGFLVSSNGYRLQGLTATAGAIYPATTLGATIGDIKIESLGTLPAGVAIRSWNVSADGTVQLAMSDGNSQNIGQVRLEKFTNPLGLSREGNNLYSNLANAGRTGGTFNTAGDPGIGNIQSNALELSNVDLANEFSTLISTQRAFQATARMITTSDEMLQELVALKR
jgi:flagellar hook protein FlgE